MPVCTVWAYLVAAAGCGGGNSATATKTMLDAGPGSGSGSNDGAADAGFPPPNALAGRWWGYLPFGTSLASSQAPVLAAFEVDAAPFPTTSWPAKLWVAGQATDFSVSASAPGSSTFGITGATGLGVTCGGAFETPVLVANGDTLSLQADKSACGGSIDEVVGTLTRSHAQRVQTAIQSVTPGPGPDARTFAYGAGSHPWLWDVSRSSLVDMAPSVADGGEVGQGKMLIALAPDDGHAIYCTQGGDMGSALVDFDIGRGVAQPIDAGVGCDARELVFSADGSHLAYTVVTPNQTAVDVRVRDLAKGTSATVYHGVATEAPFWFWAGKDGRYLVYYASPSASLGTGGEFYTPLAVYDAQSATTQSLGQARYLTASPDGRFLAFSRSDGKLAVWDEQAAAVSAIDTLSDGGAIGSYITFTNNTEDVPLGLSPDGMQLLYIDATQSLRVVALGTTTPRTVGAPMTCAAMESPTGPTAAVFSDDSKFVGYVTAAACAGSTPSLAANAFGVAAGTNLAVNVPAQDTEPSVGAVSPSGALAYAFSDAPGNMQVHVWSQATGDVDAQPKAGTFDVPLFGISDDGNRVFFRQAGLNDVETDMIWDRTLGVSMLGLDAADPEYPQDYFLPVFDRPSGIALAVDANSRAFVVSRPGAAPAASVKPDEGTAAVVSTTRKTVAVSGTLGSQRGVFSYAFPSGAKENFVEGGAVVATTDAAVYFIAADGLLVSALP